MPIAISTWSCFTKGAITNITSDQANIWVENFVFQVSPTTNYVVTNEQVFEGLEWKSPTGLLKPLTTRGKVTVENVRYAGGYGWKEATLKSQLGVDCMALGPRVFVTPGLSCC